MSFNSLPVLALIPARAGSKSVPNKNIFPVNNKPLIQYTIESALSSKFIDLSYVSSDSDQILDISKALGAHTIKRPEQYATDTASSDLLIKHAIDQWEQPDAYVVLLQPTSPLRTAEHIDNAFSLLQKSRSNNLISVYKLDKNPYKSYHMSKEGKLTPVFNEDLPFTPRQEIQDAYYPNGAIYIFKITDFMKDTCIPRCNNLAYLMNQEDSLDIDSYQDIDIATRILGGKHEARAYY